MKSYETRHVAGNLTMETVAAFFASGLHLPHADDVQKNRGENIPYTVDLSKVETVDSAAVSLLLAWVRQAQRHGIALSFTNVPQNLSSLANLYGVVDLLPIKGRATV